MSFLTATSEPVVSRARFLLVQGGLWSVCALIFAALLADTVSGTVALAIGFGSMFAVAVLVHGFVVVGVRHAAARPGTVWAGSAVASPAQLAQMNATVLANGIGSLTLALAPGSTVAGVLRLTPTALVWEPRGNGSGVRAQTLAVPLADVRSLTFALRSIRLAQVLNLRVATDYGLLDLGIASGTHDVRRALRQVGAGSVLQG